MLSDMPWPPSLWIYDKTLLYGHAAIEECKVSNIARTACIVNNTCSATVEVDAERSTWFSPTPLTVVLEGATDVSISPNVFGLSVRDISDTE